MNCRNLLRFSVFVQTYGSILVFFIRAAIGTHRRAFDIFMQRRSRRHDDRASVSVMHRWARECNFIRIGRRAFRGRAFRTGFGLQYKLRREKRTADKLINKSPATARPITLRAARFHDRYVGERLFNRGNLSRVSFARAPFN